MASRPRRRRRTEALDLNESPEAVHLVALYVGAMIECEKWLKHSLELKQQGKLEASESASAKARKFMELIVEIERGTDMRLIDAAASKLARDTLGSQVLE